MTLATVHTRALAGVDATPVQVEVHLSGGLPSLAIVGLPEAAVKESKDRVRAALINANFDFPARRITVNLAPADLPKEGGRYDLPIAIGILAASGQAPRERLEDYEFIGELALAGDLRPVRGALPSALAARDASRKLILPADNGAEAALACGDAALGASSLLAVCRHLAGDDPLGAVEAGARCDQRQLPDLLDVRGQFHAKRALEVAAAGGHNLLMVGPPGTGKSMLAARLPGILPAMNETEALEAAAVASVGRDGFDPSQWGRRPFRAPHHTASGVALVGGGGNPKPGEISLAHRGVLFLDELPEFERSVLDVLREPLENGSITISRAARQAEYPARFQLIAAMNPCPCGEAGSSGRCRCTMEQVTRYRGRLSGPFLDRIDLQVEVPRVDIATLGGRAPDGESSATVGLRVAAARERMLARAGCANAELGPSEVTRDCPLHADGERLLTRAVERLGLSARAYHRVLKVARSIADLTGEADIGEAHLAEALGYRALERAAA